MNARELFLVTVASLGATAVAESRAQEVSDAEVAALVSQIRQEVRDLREELRQFDGAVVAFDRPVDGGRICPPGWALFEPVQGRMLVGAGQHDNKDEDGKRLTDFTPWSKDNSAGKTESTGGRESVELTEAQMPRHSHVMAGLYARKAQGSSTNRVDRNSSQSAGWRTSSEGEGKAHPNMPPYLALYFCKKN